MLATCLLNETRRTRRYGDFMEPIECPESFGGAGRDTLAAAIAGERRAEAALGRSRRSVVGFEDAPRCRGPNEAFLEGSPWWMRPDCAVYP